MGTDFAITLYAPTAAQAEAALAAAFARIAELDARLSNYQSDSELSRLSQTAPQAAPVPVSDDLWHVLRAGQSFSELTDGAFDVTIGPLTRLWRRARRTGDWPDEARWQAAQQSVDFRRIEFQPADQAVRLTLPGTWLDLGGIAKGYALDEALQVVRARQISAALIVGGGEMVAGDPPPHTTGWRVGIAGLDPQTPVTQEIELAHAAVATSGDLWQFVEVDGQRYSHLIDPRSGRPLTRRTSVTVIAPTGIEADAWATAIAVLGPDQGLRRIAARPELRCRFAYLEGTQVKRAVTDHWPDAADPVARPALRPDLLLD